MTRINFEKVTNDQHPTADKGRRMVVASYKKWRHIKRGQGYTMYIGYPCKKHGNRIRYLCNMACVKCCREARSKWGKSNRPKLNALQKGK